MLGQRSMRTYACLCTDAYVSRCARNTSLRNRAPRNCIRHRLVRQCSEPKSTAQGITHWNGIERIGAGVMRCNGTEAKIAVWQGTCQHSK